MITGYKILRPDGTSVNRKWKYPLPVNGQPGEWTDVPYYGSYVSMTGGGLYCGGVPAEWICVRMECEDFSGRGPFDVERYRRVRVIEILADLPAATEVGDVWVWEAGTLSLPAATEVGGVLVYEDCTLNLPVATKVGSVEMYEGGTLTIPVAATVGNVSVYEGGTLTLPVATQVGNVWLGSGATLTLPAATKVDYVTIGKDSTLNISAATEAGTINRMEAQ